MTAAVHAGHEPRQADGVESGYAWVRLAASLVLATLGGASMWSISVILPALQQDFGLTRGEVSLSYTVAMVGFAAGGILMGRLADRLGILAPMCLGILALGAGYVLSAFTQNLWQFALVYGLLVSLAGGSAFFSPLIADISHWFERRRGLALAICASGSYLSGTIWPPIVQHFVASVGWRQTHIGLGIFCAAAMAPLALVLWRRSPVAGQPGHAGAAVPRGVAQAAAEGGPARTLGISAGDLQGLLVLAGIACCVAMSMPQVHIVAYCADLGYGTARGAEMLSVMLACGIASRLVSGWIMDRIGGLATLLIGSTLQAVALLLYVPFDGLVSLYVVSALFGLFQGGIVPSYALIVRQFFPAREAGTRVGLVLTATMAGMALGGWQSGAVYDLTGSYTAAFLNGIVWNLLNIAIAGWLLMRSRRRALRLGPTARGTEVVRP